MQGYIGEIRGFGGNFAPRFWSFCQGQLVSIAQNTALFSILGTTYGGDGRSTFALPDLRGRIPLSEGRGPGLSPRPLGQRSGTEDVTLNVLQFPNHFHFMNAQAGAVTGSGSVQTNAVTGDTAGNQFSPDDAYWAESQAGGSPAGKVYNTGTANATMAADAVQLNLTGLALNTAVINLSPTGSSHDHTNLQPYTVINWVICMQGVFPTRS